MQRILSLDGGGVRGALSAKILERIESCHPYIRKTDLFAGTSTGGIIALCLAKGMVPSRIVDLYEEHTEYIFKGRKLGWGMFRAKHDNKPFKKVLEKYFEDMRMSDLSGKVLISAFDLSSSRKVLGVNRWGAKFYDNFAGSEDLQEKVVDVAMATAAAPVYFPSYRGFVDGGLAANNPSICAASKLLRRGVPLNKIEILSVGSGVYPYGIEGDRHDWGIGQWGKKIISAFMEATNTTTDYQCRQIFGDNYYRIDIPVHYRVGLDEWEAVQELIQTASQYRTDDFCRWAIRKNKITPPSYI